MFKSRKQINGGKKYLISLNKFESVQITKHKTGRK